MNKRSIAIAAALLVVGLIAGTGPAQAKTTRHSAQSDTKTIDVHTHYTEPAMQLGFSCGGIGGAAAECMAHGTGTATFTGTMYGDVYYDMAFPDGNGDYYGPDYVTGGVEGCGKGSYIIDDYEGSIDWANYDPATNSAPGFNKWRLRAGSGTGQLTNLVSGEGENHWRINFNGQLGLAETMGEGDFTGTITCRG